MRTILVLIILSVSTLNAQSYLNMQPTSVPKLLAPDLLASPLDEYNGVFSPDGTLFLFTTSTPETGIISFTELSSKGKWTKPKAVSFSGQYSDYDPFFSQDGSRIYFSSERPSPIAEGSGDAEGSAETEGNTNIWYVEIKGGGFSDPVFVPLTGRGDYHSTFTKQGELYFNVWNDGDMYKATPDNNGYSIKKLPAILNSSSGDGDPFIAPDGRYLLFRSYHNPEEGMGRGDLYVSFLIDTSWTAPQSLGKLVNSSSRELTPLITADERFLIFASKRVQTPYSTNNLEAVKSKSKTADNGSFNIYYISADFIWEMEKEIRSK